MSSAVMPPAPPLSENQKVALISLLADEDPGIHQMVRGKLIGYGTTALTWLRPYALVDDPILRARVREIIQYIQRQANDNSFLCFCLNSREDLDLEEAVGLLAQARYPEANFDAYAALLDEYADEIGARISAERSGDRVLEVINQFLFRDLGFTGNEKYESDPANCYLNYVMDKRTGNPISLCTVYLLIARRLRLPVTGIGLPGHFVCRYQSPTREVYVDAFYGGKFLTKADCIRFLIQTNHGLHEGYLAPVTPRRMLLRMCSNLQQTYLHLEKMDDASRVKRYLVALSS